MLDYIAHGKSGKIGIGKISNSITLKLPCELFQNKFLFVGLIGLMSKVRAKRTLRINVVSTNLNEIIYQICNRVWEN